MCNRSDGIRGLWRSVSTTLCVVHFQIKHQTQTYIACSWYEGAKVGMDPGGEPQPQVGGQLNSSSLLWPILSVVGMRVRRLAWTLVASPSPR